MKKGIGAQKFIKINDISEQDILKLLKTKAKKNSFYGCCVTQLQKKKKNVRHTAKSMDIHILDYTKSEV